MTRPFRLEEDERRYFALRSEFFIRLVQSGVPAQTVHDIMRNFGKLEDMMFFEGLRQGMVVALLADDDEQHDISATAVHADHYGSAATPLARIDDAVVAEPEYAEFAGHPWLSKLPMFFGPLTLTEALEQYGPDLAVKSTPRRAASEAETREETTDLRPHPVDFRPHSQAATAEHGPDVTDASFDPMAALDALANGEDPEKVLGKIEGFAPRELEDLIELKPDAEPLNQPALLDRIRDILLRLGEPPQNWQDMILLLMRELQHDAGFLDELMSTPMGMTVVSQAKLFHLHPGAMPEIKPAAAYPAVGYGPDPSTSR